ncbi:MAG: tRNA (adenosine(37)-N6)-threonylcarbamoyltransferase complex ATPase subunit type 1 TsaE [Patescibacteria group bacterium]|nr:tRNA (adenosine(37)-N6)-threonylcarbamoyltransferase complex ATPase subunit type 1 TsaE [Patescibacteria group bacterium]
MPRKVTINYRKTRKIIKVDDMSDWEIVAEFLISKMKPGMIVTLQGDLGAGKTTLTQYIAKQLGVTKRALSPTFALIRSYDVGSLLSRKEGGRGTGDVGRLVHLDAYRIEDERDLLALDLDEELMEPGTVMIIEWPERIDNWIAKQEELLKTKIEIMN